MGKQYSELINFAKSLWNSEEVVTQKENNAYEQWKIENNINPDAIRNLEKMMGKQLKEKKNPKNPKNPNTKGDQKRAECYNNVLGKNSIVPKDERRNIRIKNFLYFYLDKY